MVRPLRIEFPGAIYHVTSRGDRREPIFDDETDRLNFLDTCAEGMDRFDACMLAYCLMGNHYHLVLHTRQSNLSRILRHLNGVYTQAYNRRHRKVGHLFQGRYKAILVDRDAYLLEVCRYVELNPVRAGIVASPDQWRWSSYLAHTGQDEAPAWLDTASVHAYLLGHPPASVREFSVAAGRYTALVAQGARANLWDTSLRQQIYLGDDAFVAHMQSRLNKAQQNAKSIPAAQRRKPAASITEFFNAHPRDEAILLAYRTGRYTMPAIAKECSLSVSQVSRIIKAADAKWET